MRFAMVWLLPVPGGADNHEILAAVGRGDCGHLRCVRGQRSKQVRGGESAVNVIGKHEFDIASVRGHVVCRLGG